MLVLPGMFLAFSNPGQFSASTACAFVHPLVWMPASAKRLREYCKRPHVPFGIILRAAHKLYGALVILDS
jgi:hypothetical protein